VNIPSLKMKSKKNLEKNFVNIIIPHLSLQRGVLTGGGVTGGVNREGIHREGG